METPREWLEVSGPTVDVAVAAAVAEFGLESPDQVEVEVIQEPKKGVLGIGGREAIVKVSRIPRQRRRRRRRRGSGGGEGRSQDAGSQDTGGAGNGSGDRRSQGRTDRGDAGRQRAEGGDRQRSGRQGSKGGGSSDRRDGRSNGRRSERSERSQGRRDSVGATVSNAGAGGAMTDRENIPTADIEDQAGVAKEFLEGLLDAFGLEGAVTTRIDDDVLYLNVEGEQTEALVGPKGSIMGSVLEITRTVVQRKTFGAPRMRLDIAGYAERRREALTIYAGKLADRVLEEGSEIMLEPMNPADRKVVHDAVAAIEGVRSYSEGEDPHRAVVIAVD